MTIAELHGKISSKGTNAHDRLEDLLTSDVFGTFLYSERWDVLSEWLGKASNEAGERLASVFPGLFPLQEVAMKFWPTSLPREPDVVLTLTGEDGNQYGLCVEAKYKSGKSNVTVEATRNGLEDDDESEEPEVPSGDQLLDQWRQLQAGRPYGWAPETRANRALLFVTAHACLPHFAFEETFEAGGSTDALQQRLFWLSWQELYVVLKTRAEDFEVATGRRRMLGDLHSLLERKRLRPFRGYEGILESMEDLQGVRPRAGVFWCEEFFRFLRHSPAVSAPTPVFWREEK